MDQQADASEPEDGEILDENEEDHRASSPEGEYEHRRLSSSDKRRSFRRNARGPYGRSRAEQHHLSSSGRRRSQGSSGSNNNRGGGSHVVSYSRSRSGGGSPHRYNTRYAQAARSKQHASSRGSPSGSRRASGSGSSNLKSSTRRSSKRKVSKDTDRLNDSCKNDQGDRGSCSQLEKRSKKSQHKQKQEHSRSGNGPIYSRNPNQPPDSSRRGAPPEQSQNIPANHDIPISPPLLPNGPSVQNEVVPQPATNKCNNVDTEPVSDDDDDDSIQVIPDEEVNAGKKSPLIITLDTTDTSDDEVQKNSEKQQQSNDNTVIVSAASPVSAEPNVEEPVDLPNTETVEEVLDKRLEEDQPPPPPCDESSAATGDLQNQVSPAVAPDSQRAIIIVQDSSSTTSDDASNASNEYEQNGAPAEGDEEDMYELELRNQLLADLVEKTVKQEIANANKSQNRAESNLLDGTKDNPVEIETEDSPVPCGSGDDNVDEEESALREVLLSQMANKKRRLIGNEENKSSPGPATPSSNHSQVSPTMISPGSKSLQDLRTPSNPNSPNSIRSIGTVRLTNSAATPTSRKGGSSSSRSRRGRNNRQAQKRSRHRSENQVTSLSLSQLSPSSGMETQHHRMVRVGVDPLWNPPHLVNRPANVRNLPDNDLRNKLLRNRRNEQQQTQEVNLSPLSTLFPEFGVADTDMRQEVRLTDAGSDMTIRRTVNFDSTSTSATATSSTAITYMAPINVDIPTDQSPLQLQSPCRVLQQNELQQHHSPSPFAHHISPLASSPLLQATTAHFNISNGTVLNPQQAQGMTHPQSDNPFICVDPYVFSTHPISASPIYSSSGHPFLPNTSLPSSSGLIMSLSGYHRGSLEADGIAPVDVDHRINREIGIPLMYSGNHQEIGRVFAGNIAIPNEILSRLREATGLSPQVSPVVNRNDNLSVAVTMIEQRAHCEPFPTAGNEVLNPTAMEKSVIQTGNGQSVEDTDDFQRLSSAIPVTSSGLLGQIAFFDETSGRGMYIAITTSALTVARDQPSVSTSSLSVARSSIDMVMSSSGSGRPISSTSEQNIGRRQRQSSSGKVGSGDKASKSASNSPNATSKIAVSSKRSTGKSNVPTPCSNTSTSSVNNIDAHHNADISRLVEQDENSKPTSNQSVSLLSSDNGSASIPPNEATLSKSIPQSKAPPSDNETSSLPPCTSAPNSTVVSVSASEASILLTSRVSTPKNSPLSGAMASEESVISSTISPVSITGSGSSTSQLPAEASSDSATPSSGSSVPAKDQMQSAEAATSAPEGNNEQIVASSSISENSSPSSKEHQSQGPHTSTMIVEPHGSPVPSSSSGSIVPPKTSPSSGELQVRNSPLLELCSVTPLRESTFNKQAKSGGAAKLPNPDSTTTATTDRPKSDNRRPPMKVSSENSNEPKSSAAKSSPKKQVQNSVSSKKSPPKDQVPAPSRKPVPKEPAPVYSKGSSTNEQGPGSTKASPPLQQAQVHPKGPPPKEPALVPPKRPPPKEQASSVAPKRPPSKDQGPVPQKRLPLKEQVSVPPKPLAKPQFQYPPKSKPVSTKLNLHLAQPIGVIPIVVPVADGDTTEDEEDEDGKRKGSDKTGDGKKRRAKKLDSDRNSSTTQPALTSAASDPSSPAFQNFLDKFLKTMRQNVDKLESERTSGSRKENKGAETTEQSEIGKVATATADNTGVTKKVVSGSTDNIEVASTVTVVTTENINSSDLVKPTEEQTASQKPTMEKKSGPPKTVKTLQVPPVSREISSGMEDPKLTRKRQASPGLQTAVQNKKKANTGEGQQSHGVGTQTTEAISSVVVPVVLPTAKALGMMPSSNNSEILVNSKAVIESLTERVNETRDQIQLSFKEKELLQSRQNCYDEYREILRDLQQHTRLTNFDTKLGQDIEELEKKLAGMKKRRETVQLKAIDLNRTIREKSKVALNQKKMCLSLATEVKKLGDRLIGENKYKVPPILVENINELVRNMKTMDSKQSQNLQRERGVTFKQLILEEGTFSAAPSGTKGPAATAGGNIPTRAQSSAVTTSSTGNPPQHQPQQQKQMPSATDKRDNGRSVTSDDVQKGQEGKNGREGAAEPSTSAAATSSKDEEMPLFITKRVSGGGNQDSEQGKQEKEVIKVSDDRLPLKAGDVLSATTSDVMKKIDIDSREDSSVLEPMNKTGVHLCPHTAICPASLSDGICTDVDCKLQHL